jgi:O-antigen ligase
MAIHSRRRIRIVFFIFEVYSPPNISKRSYQQATSIPNAAFVFLSEVCPIMSENSRYFLRNKFHYYLVLAVIATTLFSWLNLNSYLIILLLFCRLIDGGPRAAFRSAFRNIFFWAYAVIFLVELAGLLYTHDLSAAWKDMESKATLVAIPFIFLGGPFTDREGYRRLLTAYCWLLTTVCLYCLMMAVVEYRWQRDIGVFFYHDLTSAVGINAVFFSGYVLIAIFFLLFSASDRRMRIALLLFFTGIMLLLSSRLLILLLAIAFIVYAIGRRLPKMKVAAAFSLALLIVLGLATLAFTDNPFSRRYRELSPGRLSNSIQREPISDTRADGISLRLFMWRAAFEILEERHAWAPGVTGGDSQALLDQKYVDAGLSQGYLGYNFHNEYIEVLVHSGLIGWTLFILAMAALIVMARITGTLPAVFTTGLILLLCSTESALEMQHGLFLSCFFPLLHYCGRNF